VYDGNVIDLFKYRGAIHAVTATRLSAYQHMSEETVVLGFLISVACWTFVVLPLLYYFR